VGKALSNVKKKKHTVNFSCLRRRVTHWSGLRQRGLLQDIIEHTIISKHIFTLTPFYTPAVLIFTVKGCNQNIFMMLICVAASYNGTLAVEIRLNTPT